MSIKNSFERRNSKMKKLSDEKMTLDVEDAFGQSPKCWTCAGCLITPGMPDLEVFFVTGWNEE
ncbi:hypothetical protein HMPREF9089_00796 [Eubacterium brachy ATCC 33089]|nr:hypothetical protein HMPREF9089_00796 [Eubacterium brachy ATCC 33089]